MPSDCQKKSSENLTPPIDDPEALICAKNAEKRRLAKLAKAAAEVKSPAESATAVSTSPNAPIPSTATQAMASQELPFTPGAFSNTSGSTPKEGPSTGSSSLPTVPKPDERSTDELVRLLLAAQHASTVQSLADRQALAADRQALAVERRANQERMAQFEQAIVRLSVKPESSAPPSQATEKGIDLQRFRIADGPVY